LYFRDLSEAGVLTQFGAALQTLLPGGRSSQTHWHTEEDEFLYMLDGRLTVIEGETETAIGPGDACCWKAGTPVGHSLRNDSDAAASYLIVGSRIFADVCHYPGLDLRDEPHGDRHRYVHLDGRPWEAKDAERPPRPAAAAPGGASSGPNRLENQPCPNLTIPSMPTASPPSPGICPASR
jgi:uncharacterized cupin superfamily protein